jgi:hypothetical protein
MVRMPPARSMAARGQSLLAVAPKVTKNACPCCPPFPPVLALCGTRQRHTKASLTLRTVCGDDTGFTNSRPHNAPRFGVGRRGRELVELPPNFYPNSQKEQNKRRQCVNACYHGADPIEVFARRSAQLPSCAQECRKRYEPSANDNYVAVEISVGRLIWVSVNTPDGLICEQIE